MGKATEYTRVAVDKLIPYANNAKQHSDSQVTKIASSIREFGFLNPVLIDASYNVIAGHGRILAAKKLGLSEVPCLFVEGLTEAQHKAYILADNRLSELGEWDMERVMGELAELDELGFEGYDFGFDIDEIEPQEINHGALTEKWLVPPFSVLHANKGAWLDRKRKWVEFGIRSEIGRGGDLCYSFPSGWVGKGQGGNKDE